MWEIEAVCLSFVKNNNNNLNSNNLFGVSCCYVSYFVSLPFIFCSWIFFLVFAFWFWQKRLHIEIFEIVIACS